MRHLIDPTDFTVEEIEQLMLRALDIIDNRAKYADACRGKKLATLFYEPSTRTRLSFTAAMMELGAMCSDSPMLPTHRLVKVKPLPTLLA